ncbi:unnamed protein product [Lactuca virosa]|uniref:Uncharacterized protein n=1 Tax=Lactuca virosa TaxID=75947 RepID=A0AAU9P5H0_9ASTR|nr:unnamed protein product [Lactuca virosa]
MEFYVDDLVPWLENQTSNLATGSASASVTMAMDALVPSSNTHLQTLRSAANGSMVPGSTRVTSCSGDQSGFMDQWVARSGAAVAHEWSSCKDQSVSGSATFAGMESGLQMTVETCEREFGGKAFTSTYTGSPENTTSGKRSTESTSPDDNDSVGHSKHQGKVAGSFEEIRVVMGGGFGGEMVKVGLGEAVAGMEIVELGTVFGDGEWRNKGRESRGVDLHMHIHFKTQTTVGFEGTRANVSSSLPMQLEFETYFSPLINPSNYTPQCTHTHTA